MVFQPVTRGAQPDVLPVPVRQSEQLHAADQLRIIRQPRPSTLLPVHWTIHCHGALAFYICLMIFGR